MFGENIEKVGIGKISKHREWKPRPRPKSKRKKKSKIKKEQTIVMTDNIQEIEQVPEKVNKETKQRGVQEIEQTPEPIIKKKKTQVESRSNNRWEFYRDRIIFRPSVIRREVH
jgi:ribosomal protein S21